MLGPAFGQVFNRRRRLLPTERPQGAVAVLDRRAMRSFGAGAVHHGIDAERTELIEATPLDHHIDAVPVLPITHDAADMADQLPGLRQCLQVVAHERREPMPVTIPVGAQVAQETPLLREWQARPQDRRCRPQGIDGGAPVTALGSNVMTDVAQPGTDRAPGYRGINPSIPTTIRYTATR